MIEIGITLAFWGVPILLGYVFGRAAESKRFRSIAQRELHCRYGHAGGATELFEALKNEDADASALSHYLASHPSMQARVDALQGAASKHGMPVRAVRPL